MKALFITFEGVDGAGKTTQIEMLRRGLDQRGLGYMMLREPGSTPAGEAIRGVLLNHAYAEMSPATEVLLYAAARAQMVAQVVRPALESGTPVLCDRYVDSSLAYQAYGGGVDAATVGFINAWATGGLMPDLTIIFDLDPLQAGRRRAGFTADRVEAKPAEFHRRVRQGYLDIAAREPARVKVVNAARPPGIIAAEVWALVAGVLEI